MSEFPTQTAHGPERLPQPSDLSAATAVRWLLWTLLALSAFRVFYLVVSPIELSGDEAQYWDWARNLDWGYFSKGPVVAWCIAASCALLGDTELAIRLPAVLMLAAASGAMFLLARRIYGNRVALWAALLMQGVPIFAAFAIGMTIDPPYLLCWITALWLLHRAANDRRWWDWPLLGAAVGLGLLTKYTTAIFYPAALGYLLTDPARRRRLKHPLPWLSVLLSLAFLVPLLAWDSQHGWVNLQHNLGHTRVDEGFRLRPMLSLEFVGGQLGVITPILAPMMVIAAVKRRKRDPLSFWFCVPLLGFFVLKSVQGRVNPNWPLAAWVTGFIAFCGHFLTAYPQRNIHLRRLTRAAVLVPLIATAVAHVVVVVPLPIPARYDHTLRMVGWSEIGREVGRIGNELGPRHFIVSHQRTLATRLAFYVPDKPRTYTLGHPWIVSSQHDLWPGYEHLTGYDAIYVLYDDKWTPDGDRPEPQLPGGFARRFRSVEPRRFEVHDALGRTVRHYWIWVCRDQGAGPPPDRAAARSELHPSRTRGEQKESQ